MASYNNMQGYINPQYAYPNNLIMNTPYDNFIGVKNQNFNNQFLKCRPVASKEQAKAAQIDLDGSLWVFTDDGSFAIGSCDNLTRSIYLNENLQGQLLKKVLCHEITHAAMFSYNVNLSLEQQELIADLISTYGDEIIYITNKIFNKLGSI